MSEDNVAAEQLVLEPVRARIRADHRRRKKGVNDLRCHVIDPLLLAVFGLGSADLMTGSRL